MAILKKDELLQAVQAKLTSSDDDLTLLENITDTINELSARDNEDWKAKYEENDRAWRERYKARFSEPSAKQTVEEKVATPAKEDDIPKSADITIDKLFE